MFCGRFSRVRFSGSWKLTPRIYLWVWWSKLQAHMLCCKPVEVLCGCEWIERYLIKNIYRERKNDCLHHTHRIWAKPNWSTTKAQHLQLQLRFQMQGNLTQTNATALTKTHKIVSYIEQMVRSLTALLFISDFWSGFHMAVSERLRKKWTEISHYE